MERKKRCVLLVSAGLFSLNLIGNNDSLKLPPQMREIPGRISIQRLSINSQSSDYSPQLHNGYLYFVSERVRQAGIQYTDEKGSSAISDMYVARLRDSVHFAKPSLIKELSSKFHEGPFCVSSDEKKMMLTGNSKDGLNKIFEVEKKNGMWGKPEMIPFCENDYSYCHPTLSPDGKMLVFSSNRSGSGGMDLFYSYRTDSGWSDPVNAGSQLNTSANEVFPFLASGKKLLFASNRENGFGGLDLYKIDLDSANALALHLGTPFNSEADDFGIWTDSTLTRGYLSSNRLKSKSDDIYYFSVIIPDFSAASTPTVKSSFCYNFYEETTLGNNDTSNLDFEWDCGDGNKKRGLKARHCYTSPGNYIVKLNVVEKLSGEIFNSLVEYELNIITPEKLYISCNDSVRAGVSLQINCFNSALKGYQIAEKYWSFGDGYYNTGDAVSHVYSQPGQYDLELWVNCVSIATEKKEKFKITKKVNVTSNINAE